MTTISRDDLSNSLREFKRRRDAVLHNDAAEMVLNLRRFVEFCDSDMLVQSVLQKLPTMASQEWWNKLHREWRRGGVEHWQFPSTRNEEMSLRYALMKDMVEGKSSMIAFGDAIGVFDRAEQAERFVSLIVHPFCEILSDDIREAANIPHEEKRALQAVPLHLIPSDKETRIFLSHKSTDKALIYRYHNVLRELGFSTWLDTQDMPVGTQLDRAIAQGFEESCAAVFFITENFKDESFIADEINYAKQQTRNKGKKFSIITLRFASHVEIPLLLRPYIWNDVHNELEGLHELLRALPIELGPVRWKQRVT